MRVHMQREDGRARLITETDAGEWVADCLVATEYLHALGDALHELDAEADTDWQREVAPAGGEAGETTHVPLTWLDPRTGHLIRGARPLVTLEERDPGTEDRLHSTRTAEVQALLARLRYLVRETEADWNEARAASDKERARRIRNFELKSLYDWGVWTPPSLRRRMKR